VLEMSFPTLPVHHPHVNQPHPHLQADAHMTRPHVFEAVPALQQRSVSSPARPPHMPVTVLPDGGDDDSAADALKGGAGEPLRLGDLPIPTHTRCGTPVHVSPVLPTPVLNRSGDGNHLARPVRDTFALSSL
jgi:hypothetical protein